MKQGFTGRFAGMLGMVFTVGLACPGYAENTTLENTTLKEYASAAQTLRGTLDTLSFDYDSLTLDLSVMDIPAIAAALDARMETQVYSGVLRAGKGALATGAGNALDQALALAGALREAGYDVRIAHAALGESDAKSLLANSRAIATSPAALDTSAAVSALQNMQTLINDTDALQPVQTLLETGLPAAAKSQEALDIAAAAQVTLPDPAILDAQLLAEAQDYYWVQARLFGLDDWQDLHIAFTPENAITPVDFLANPLPKDLLHQIRVELMVETREDGDFRTVGLMQQQDFPVANLGRAPVVLSVVPDIMLRGGVLADVTDSAFYFPLLGDELAPYAKAFTMFGATLDADDVLASGGAADLFSSIATTTSVASGILGSLGAADEEAEQAPVTETTGLILQVTYYPPNDADSITYRRYLVDRIGPENRAAENGQVADDARPLVGVWTLNISSGETGAAEMLDLQIERINKVAESGNPGMVNPAESTTLTAFFDAAAVAGAGEGVLVYRGAPFIMLTETALTPDGSRVYATDIMQTGLRALSGQDTGWHADPAAAFRAGVAQTRLEAMLMDGADSRGATRARSGSWAVLSAMPDLVVITDKNSLDDLDISEAAKAAALRDLKRGNILAMAVGETPAWWRIDPVTGATIGVDTHGYGAEAVEYLQIIDVILTSAFGINGAVQCGTDLCCQATNAGWTILGFALIGGAGEAATALNMTDNLFATSLGLSAGVGVALTGQNPLSGLCE